MKKNKTHEFFIAQTSESPPGLEIESAKGIYLYDIHGKIYLDLISGVGVQNLGHNHPRIIKAIKHQLAKHLHVMVFGEFKQKPQLELASHLAFLLPPPLNCFYLVNSGSEAVEGAIKLAKKFTKRKEIISFKNAYHGSTLGALSVMGNDRFKTPFLPLLPHTRTIEFNDLDGLNDISGNTACVIAETVQGEAGVIEPKKDFLAKLNIRCKKTGALLILDEIQTGFGRTGKFFGFENYGVLPDIVLFAKALGGGMPIGAFCSSKKIMDTLKTNPPLSHLTTFGGHPVSCAAAVAGIEILKEENLVPKVAGKGKLFKSLLVHPAIKKIRGIGLMIAVELESAELAQKLVSRCIKNGLITDSFLFAENCLRIAPPLIISEDEIMQACTIFNASIEQVMQEEC